MVKIRPEDKEEITFTEWLPEGVHKVKIQSIEQKTNTNDKEYFEFTVADENDATGIHRLYMTEAAMKYSINTIRDIFVHNTVQKNRDIIRDKVNKCEDTDELFKLSQSLVGKECWYSRFANGQTYPGSDGTMRNSYDTKIAGYELKPPAEKSKEAQVNDLLGGAQEVDDNDVPFN